jgi:hypoxanthine phosphoribosyltransferase
VSGESAAAPAGAEALAVLSGASELFSPAEVSAALATMAERAEQLLARANPVVLAMMQGGVYAALELCRRFSFPYQFDYLHVSRYRGALTGGRIEWIVPPRPSLAGRAVLLVDDVLDRGDTLREAQAALRAVGVGELRTAVLVAKRIDGIRRPAVDFVGLEADDFYLFGCGMDYKGYWRGLPAIYAAESVDAT